MPIHQKTLYKITITFMEKRIAPPFMEEYMMHAQKLPLRETKHPSGAPLQVCRENNHPFTVNPFPRVKIQTTLLRGAGNSLHLIIDFFSPPVLGLT